MSQEETDYAWLDKVVAELPMIHQFGCPALEYSDGSLMDYTCHCGNSRKAKTVIQAHLTAQAKQHQVELVRVRIELLLARIGELIWVRDSFIFSNDSDKKVFDIAISLRMKDIQAELDKLEGKNE